MRLYFFRFKLKSAPGFKLCLERFEIKSWKKKNILFILIEALSDYKDNETRFSYKM